MFNRIHKTLVLRLTSIIVLIALVLPAAMPVAAQDFTLPADGYFLSGDANGVLQVWYLPADTLQPQQLTSAEVDIIEYAVSQDGSQIAYVSDRGLWLKYLTGNTEPVQLVELYTMHLSHPVFSPNGSEIAYGNQGISVFNIETGENRKLVEDVELAPDGSNVPEFRIYIPDRYTDNGKHLYLKIGVWEWNTPGLLNLETGTIHEVEPYVHSELQLLDDGRGLVYGNTPVGGEWDIRIMGENLETVEKLFDLRELFTETTVFINQAVQLDERLFRFSAWTMQPVSDMPVMGNAIFDFDIETGEIVRELSEYVVPEGNNGPSTINSQLSPDGRLLPVYINATYDTELYSGGIPTGDLVFVNVENGQTLFVETANQVVSFQWAHR